MPPSRPYPIPRAAARFGSGSYGSTVAASLLSETTAYDSLGRVTKTVTPLGRATTQGYAWDATVTDLAGSAVGGWIHTTTNPIGHATVVTLDVFGRSMQERPMAAMVWRAWRRRSRA